MRRISFAIEDGAGRGAECGAPLLTQSIRKTLGEMIAALPARDSVRTVMLAGNTAMHHLFCGIDVAPLAQFPFHPVQDGEQVFSAQEVGWDLPQASVRFLPCLGGFVGSDILAGILATGISTSNELCALIDLGTNGEIVVGNRERMLCASTAAGPAFEGGRIRMGMRAAAGAIAHVAIRNGELACSVMGNGVTGNGVLGSGVLGTPRGICGSGLVDAAAAGVQLGAILSNGRLSGGAREFPLLAPVSVSQADLRELQLAKAAIAAGLRILTGRWGAALQDIHTVYLAGAFGNYLNLQSARRIGLIEVEEAHVKAAGNTSLRGVKMASLRPSQRQAWITETRAHTEHIPLAEDPRFAETFVDCLAFTR